jgi:transketolase
VKAIDLLAEQGIFVQLWNVACPLDLDETALKSAAKTGVVFTYEDHNVHTGLGNCIADKYLQLGLSAEFHKFGVEDYAFSGSSEDVFKACGLDVNSVVERIKAVMK